MSDPSSTLEKRIKNWREERSIKKSRSTNQICNVEEKVNEIEAVDFKDGKVLISIDSHKSFKLTLFLFTLMILLTICMWLEVQNYGQGELWKLPGFTQAFHCWKANKRASSPSFDVFITYIALPFHFIIKDLLDSKRRPLLTF